MVKPREQADGLAPRSTAPWIRGVTQASGSPSGDVPRAVTPIGPASPTEMITDEVPVTPPANDTPPTDPGSRSGFVLICSGRRVTTELGQSLALALLMPPPVMLKALSTILPLPADTGDRNAKLDAGLDVEVPESDGLPKALTTIVQGMEALNKGCSSSEVGSCGSAPIRQNDVGDRRPAQPLRTTDAPGPVGVHPKVVPGVAGLKVSGPATDLDSALTRRRQPDDTVMGASAGSIRLGRNLPDTKFTGLSPGEAGDTGVADRSRARPAIYGLPVPAVASMNG